MAKKKKSLEYGTMSMSSGFAGLPQEVMMKPYPSGGRGSSNPELVDTLPGIDYQMYEDKKRQKKDRWPEKY